MTTLKIQRIGNSLGAVFSQDILQKLKVQEGDTVLVTETPYGICLTSCDSDLDKVMEAYSKVSSRYQNPLRQLAK